MIPNRTERDTLEQQLATIGKFHADYLSYLQRNLLSLQDWQHIGKVYRACLDLPPAPRADDAPCPVCNGRTGYHNAVVCPRAPAPPVFTVVEHHSGFSLRHNPSRKTHWLSDGVGVFEDMTPGDPDFRQRWEDEFNADASDTWHAYFPELAEQEDN
jgi:hypothetical protein